MAEQPRAERALTVPNRDVSAQHPMPDERIDVEVDDLAREVELHRVLRNPELARPGGRIVAVGSGRAHPPTLANAVPAQNVPRAPSTGSVAPSPERAQPSVGATLNDPAGGVSPRFAFASAAEKKASAENETNEIAPSAPTDVMTPSGGSTSENPMPMSTVASTSV